MRRIALAVAVACFALHCASSGVTPSASVVGRSQVGTRVDAVFADYAKPDVPGCAVGIAQGGKTILERGYGMANLEHGIPITPATIFEAGSVSKQFAAAAIAILAADGRLSLDDPARKFLPELDESAAAVTVRQLLQHTSGLRDFGAVIGIAGWPRGSRVLTHEDVLEVTARQRALNFAPGTQWTYNTGAYNLLAVIVERVSGKALPEFTRERMFVPLGMTSSSWRDDVRRVVRGRAASYGRAAEGTFRTAIDVESIYGNCCMLTTVGDLLRWNANFSTAAAVGRKPLDAMQVPATLADGRRLDYGLGLFIDETPGRRIVSHSGATAGYRAFLTRRIDDDLSIALLCNRADAPLGALIDQVTAAVQGRSVESRASSSSSDDGPSAFAGLWRDPHSDAILAIEPDRGRLYLRARPGGSGPELTIVREGELLIGRNQLRLADDGLHLRPAHKPEAVYVRVERVSPSAEELGEYEGSYRSDEADATWTVTVEDGRLVARPRRSWTIRMDPTYRDGFITDGNDLVRFTRDAAGKIDGLEVKAEFAMAEGAARLERLRFVRE